MVSTTLLHFLCLSKTWGSFIFASWVLIFGTAEQCYKEAYYFSRRRSYFTSKDRCKRTTRDGYWKPTGKLREIRSGANGEVIGSKRCLVFHYGRSVGQSTGYTMHEYSSAAGISSSQVFINILEHRIGDWTADKFESWFAFCSQWWIWSCAKWWRRAAKLKQLQNKVIRRREQYHYRLPTILWPLILLRHCNEKKKLSRVAHHQLRLTGTVQRK